MKAVASLYPTYARAELSFERGQGAYLYTAAGERYLDFASGIAVTALGHSHPHLVEALTRQGAKLWHVSNMYDIPEQRRLADRLVAHSFADTVFFGNSGAEAIECAIKTARRHYHAKGQPERHRIITMSGAFHGRTLATIAAGGNPKYLDGFAPSLDGFDHVAWDNMNELRAAIGPATAAIMVEPVQGEGGLRALPAETLRALRVVADEYGLLLIFDEVQCGMGRTGLLFAHEACGVQPDIMALAKGLGGGFPVGACLATAAAASGMVAGTHGSTFGGNPLAMAVADAVLDVLLEPGFLDRVAAAARALRAGLAELIQRHPGVFDSLRGDGLMIGLKCVVPNGEVQQRLRAANMLTVTAADNVLRILPPLIIGDAEIAEALGCLDQVASSWRH